MKKGSALLIVLGMVAFMIVSAVAFASYMRFSRLPSNFLRRTSSSRLLVKAALARAIDKIDAAIGNNPHPGIGEMKSMYPRFVDINAQPLNRNIWLHRVFFGSNTDFYGSFEEGLAETVPVLTLEGLAYIPPPLVNDVRYYSRLTKTAAWQPLGFDAGRYAFCAVDVSDYFDVNRLMSDKPRSSAPNGRVSLAYLFENKDHTAVGSGAKQWDEWMANFRSVDTASGEISWNSTFPFISLADFNLALGHEGGSGDMKGFFYDYIDRGTGEGGFYGDLNVSDFYKAQRMTFVTDGFFPAETYEDDLDLNDPVHQPFKAAFLKKDNPALGGALFGTDDAMQDSSDWQNRISGVGCAALYDYLDEDHVPLSLAVPTVERAPMICGIQPGYSGGKLGLVREYAQEEGPEGGTGAGSLTIVSGGGAGAETRTVRKTILYRIDPVTLGQGFAAGNLRALAVFPFNHASDDDAAPFKVDGRLSLFFTYGSDSMGLRPGFGNEALQLPKNIEAGVNAGKGLLNVMFEPQQLKFSAGSRIASREDAVDDAVDFPLITGREVCTKLNEAGNELLRVTYEWTQTATMDAMGNASWGPQFASVKGDAANIATVETGLKLLDAATGEPIGDNVVKGALAGDGLPIRLNVAVWLRVTDGDDHVVDLVPACLEDDSVMNPSTTGEDRYSNILKGDARDGGDNDLCGKPYPLLRFDVDNGARTITMADLVQALDAGDGKKTWEDELTLSQKAILVADPRYNYAPEHWFVASAGGVIDKNTWLDNNHVTAGDGDIFLAVSDAGHLQSKYELAFIPRFTDGLNDTGSSCRGKLLPPTQGFGGGKSLATSFTQTSANRDLVWQTYDPIGVDYEAFKDLPWTNEGTGLKVNPYSDTTNVLMAAFANTPMDWTHASTNVIRQIEASMTAEKFNKQYALNEYSDDLKIAWKDLEGMAGSLIDAVRTGSNGTDWEAAWKTLWQNKTEIDAQDGLVKLMNRELSDDTDTLWNADRKFLYGFWKDCFAARQQLFLVFVRAEPMMMGGGGNGQIPPQLGGRAVALVWRDPTASPNNDDPHRTRVLFYRQLD